VADVRPFRALRPVPHLAPRVSAPPYDVVDVDEARALAAGNPDSFLHVSRPEIDLPAGTPADSPAVHDAGRAALVDLVERGVLTLDDRPTYSVYRQRLGDAVQTGVVACVAVDDYASGVVRTHEHTRPDKESDRVHHVDALGAHDEPVFLLAPRDPAVTRVLAQVTAGDPQVRFTAADGVEHTLWTVTDPARVRDLRDAYASMPRLYVADGHHRSAAAARVAAAHADRDGTDEFPVVVFPGEELQILPYHRLVADLAGRDVDTWLRDLGSAMAIARVGPAGSPGVQPSTRGRLAMYLDGTWYVLAVRDGLIDPAREADPAARLDVAVLQDFVLGPGLAITDPRSDVRISFVGGGRGLAELERQVDSGRWAMAFAMAPVSVEDLVAVAASGQTMPPKSTWFEPKLRSGLFVHPFGG
jgi:uncharacterized protein (DUF1015 family)